MARPREFDEQKTLQAVAEAFWTRGYEATSTRDLAQRTGLTVTSLYNAFGDKQALFQRALQHYLDATLRERIDRLEQTLAPSEAIAAFLNEVIERSLSDRQQRGCFLVNSALEATPDAPELRAAIATEIDAVRAFFPSRDRRIECCECGDHEHDRFGIDLDQLFERGQPTHSRHRHIHQDQVVRFLRVRFERLFARSGEIDFISGARQNCVEHISHYLFVIADEN